MRINIEKYHEHYHQNGKFKDNWQEGIKLLPFSSNPASTFDKQCGLQGTTGEFFRLCSNDGTQPIEDFKKTAIDPVSEYLSVQKQMPREQIDEFTDMMKDIMLVNGNLNITDSVFLKYLPLVPNDESISSVDRKRYKAGQRKLANYLYSMLSNKHQNTGHHVVHNLFSKILQEALTPFDVPLEEEIIRDYVILPYIKESFQEDFKWLMEQEETVKVKYSHLFLYFYVCYSIVQTIVNISAKRTDKILGPEPFFFVLNSEKVSLNHDAITRGWSSKIPKTTLDKLYGRSQALDILNSVLGGNIGFYFDILSKLEQTPFEENKSLCFDLLNTYQADKRGALANRDSERHILSSFGEVDINIHSYNDVLNIMERLCMGLQSPSYISRMRKKVVDLLSVRFLQNRKRSGYVLALDNEMLIFLIALFTKSKKTKLEDMYKRFNGYGIYFNRGSRLAIEEYLLKLNLLDRKSDSGEAQYVTVIL